MNRCLAAELVQGHNPNGSVIPVVPRDRGSAGGSEGVVRSMDLNVVQLVLLLVRLRSWAGKLEREL